MYHSFFFFFFFSIVFLTIHLLKDILIAASFCSYEQRCYKHLGAGFCVDRSFQLIWVDTKEHDCWIA